MIPTPSPINQLRTKCKSSFLNSMLYYNGALLLEKKKDIPYGANAQNFKGCYANLETSQYIQSNWATYIKWVV